MKRSLIALVFLLPLYSQAQDTPQVKDTTSQTKDTSQAQDTSIKEDTSKTKEIPQTKDATPQTKEASQAKDTTPQIKDTSQAKDNTPQTQNAFYISGLLGFSRMDKMEGISFDTGVSFGARLGFLFNDHFSLGIHAQSYSSPPTHPDYEYLLKDLTFTFNNWMVEFNYYINKADEENGFWFGGLLGVTQVRLTEFESNNERSNEIAFGVSCGYHFMVARNLTISPQITYVRTDPNNFSHSLTQFSGLINLTYYLALVQ